jgi:hypothetical protein
MEDQPGSGARSRSAHLRHCAIAGAVEGPARGFGMILAMFVGLVVIRRRAGRA